MARTDTLVLVVHLVASITHALERSGKVFASGVSPTVVCVLVTLVDV